MPGPLRAIAPRFGNNGCAPVSCWNRSGISGFSGHSRNPTRMSADVYDLPALERLMRRLNGGEIKYPM